MTERIIGDAEYGRFLSVDPLAGEYANWSTYNYVVGNPITFIDPSGRSPVEGFNVYVDGVKTDDSEDSYWRNQIGRFNAERQKSEYTIGTFVVQMDARIVAPIVALNRKKFGSAPLGITASATLGIMFDGNTMALVRSHSGGLGLGFGVTGGFSGGFFPRAKVEDLLGLGVSGGAFGNLKQEGTSLVSFRGFSVDLSFNSEVQSWRDLNLGATIELSGFTWGFAGYAEANKTYPIWGPYDLSDLLVGSPPIAELAKKFKTSNAQALQTIVNIIQGHDVLKKQYEVIMKND